MRFALLVFVIPALAWAQTAPRVIADSKPGMGTRQQVMIWSADESQARAHIAAAFAEMDRLESVLSEWRPDSEVSRVNQAAGKGPVTVGPDTLAVIERGKAFSLLTSGAFSLTWAALAPLWPISSEPWTLPDPAAVRERLAFVDDQKLIIDHEHSTITLPAGMTVGVGAIAEGYTLERVTALLRQRGANDALVFIGGDIAAIGKKGNKPWVVGVQDPRAPGYFATLAVEDETISTSGDYEKYVEKDGRRYSHILDPRTGMPAQGTRSATIIAKDPMTADALDTALMVLGPTAAMKLVEAQPGVQAVIVDADNKITLSRGLKDRLRIVRPPTP